MRKGATSAATKKSRREVAGPYRSQSSNPKIRKKATKREHRTVTVPPSGLSVPDSLTTPSVVNTPAERTAARLRKRRAQTALQLLADMKKEAGIEGIEDSPQYAYLKAHTEGRFPSAKLKEKYPRAYKRAEEEAHAYLRERENVKPDPLAELAIDALATKGLGTLAGKVGGKLAGSLGAKLASTEATVAETAAERGGKALAKNLAKPAKKAKALKRVARTSDGRKVLKAAEGERIAKAGKRAAKKPVRSTLGVQAGAAPLGLELGPGGALVEGTGKAIYENPLGTVGATGRGVVGAVTAPLALGRAAIESARTGNIDPLEATAREQVQGTLELGEDLLSGDPAKVQKTIEEDVGLTPFAGALALPRTRAWKTGRTKLRKAAATGRRKAADVTGSQRIRVVPKEAAGDSYVFAPLERRAARKRVAKQVTRETNPARSQAAHHQKKILENLRKAPIARSLRNRKGMEAGDLLQTLAEYGIRTQDDVKLVREHGPVGKVPDAGMVTLRSALDFAEKHPEVLTDKHFKRALDAYIESTKALPAAKAGKGERARLMAQGDMFKITRPEDRVPVKARPYTDATTRAGAWADAAAREKEIGALRREARKYADQAQAATGHKRELLKAQAAHRYRQARQLEDVNRKLVKTLGRYSMPGQALKASARKKFYDAALLKEYEADVTAARAQTGLAEPAWTAHQRFREPGEIGPAYPTAASRVQHMRTGVLSANDVVDRSLRSLLAGSVVGPRLRAGGQELARRFTEQEMMPVRVGENTSKYVVTSKEWSDALREGQYDPRSFVMFPARQFKQAILDPFRSPEDVVGIAGESLEKGLNAGNPGNKYVIVRREAAKEFTAQIDPRKYAGEALINGASKGVSRWLLFSPAWMMIQSVAEAIPMVMAHPELMNPAKIAKLEREIRKNTKLNPDEARAFAAVAGEAPAGLRTPDDLRPALDSNPHGIFSDGARALTKSRLGQGMFSLVRLRPFAVFDNWRQGKYRELLMAAEADKRLNGWTSSLKQTLKLQKQISDELRGLPLNEQMAALTKPKYRKQLDEMQKHVENIAGDWQSFSRYERSFAPFAVFYPFIRYSLRWPLTFAKQHPISATVYAFLGEANAEQIEKILGHAPSNPLAYAIPVWNSGEVDEGKYQELVDMGMSEERAKYIAEHHMILSGQRAAPGLSAPTQAIASQEPSQALSVFNPLIGAGITFATGVDAYSGRQEATSAAEKAKQAANQLLATSPLMRFFDLQIDEPESIAGKRFSQLDKSKRERSLYKPWSDLPAANWKAIEDFGRDLDQKYGDPVPSTWDNPLIGEALYGGKRSRGVIKGDYRLYRRLLRQHKLSEAASDRVKAQEEQFFEDTGDLSPVEQKRLSKALESLQGGFFVPTEPKKKVRRKGKGIGGAGGSGIGGYSLSGDSGIGGAPAGERIGGYSLGGS